MSAAPGPSASSVALPRPGPFPNWMMLERFVFRRDDEESFPDDRKAYLSVSGTTSWNAPFRIAFCLYKPPLPSRLYAHLPSFPDPRRHIPLAILATHRHLILLRIATDAPGRGLLQDFLIYSAYYSSSFKSLPPCTQPYTDYTKIETGDSLPRGHPLPKDKQRLLMVESMGLLCGGSHEFAVVELRVFTSESSKVYADLCFIRSSTSAAPVVGGRWESVRVPILDSSKDPWNLCCWQTDTIVPFDSFLCWVDYHRGIIICDPFGDPIPTVSFLPLPIDKPTCAHTHYQVKPSSWLYRGVSGIYGDRALNFINVIRHDDIGYGALKPGSGFTITSHNLVPGRKWTRDYEINSAKLWSSNPCLPHTILTFPQVNINRPHVVQFLMSESKYVIKRMWVVSINMPTGMVESISQYINGKEGLKGDDADFTRRRSGAPASFIPCEFFKFLRRSQADEAAFDDVHQDKQNNYIQSGGSIVLGESSDGGADDFRRIKLL